MGEGLLLAGLRRTPRLEVNLKVLRDRRTHFLPLGVMSWTVKRVLGTKRERCKRAKSGSSIRERHEMDTQRKRRRDLTGSRESSSGKRSFGRL